jgi:NAD(P)-dependent dehydrogenase (short-subunit alcohol dehydrogenase family)
MAGRLEGKAALITGGAGSIGLATARAFLSEGAQVLIVDRDEQALADIATTGGAKELAYRAADVTDEAQVEAAVADAVQRFGKLDVAFANAGIFGNVAPITEYSLETFMDVLNVNVAGSLLVAKHALRVMSSGGSLIFNSSVVGVTAAPNIAAYATSKHALVGLMRVAAKEMAPRGIRVNSLHPGPTDNEFQDRVEMAETGAEKPQANKVFNSFIPLGRHADPAEIAQAVVFLASDESAFMTGHTLVLDGGLSI